MVGQQEAGVTELLDLADMLDELGPAAGRRNACGEAKRPDNANLRPSTEMGAFISNGRLH
jgi:hypothetical protein